MQRTVQSSKPSRRNHGASYIDYFAYDVAMGTERLEEVTTITFGYNEDEVEVDSSAYNVLKGSCFE